MRLSFSMRFVGGAIVGVVLLELFVMPSILLTFNMIY